jgi:hypothetical protein
MRDEHAWDDARHRPYDMTHSDHLGIDPHNFDDADAYYHARSMGEVHDRMKRASMSEPSTYRPSEDSSQYVQPVYYAPPGQDGRLAPQLPLEHGRAHCGAACDCQLGCIPATPGWVAHQMETMRRKQRARSIVRTIAVVLFLLLWFGFAAA